MAAIQNLAQQNKQQISAIQAEMSLLKNLSKPRSPKERSKDDRKSKSPTYDQETIENILNHLSTLQDEQVCLSANLSNVSTDMKDEFYRKQA